MYQVRKSAPKRQEIHQGRLATSSIAISVHSLRRARNEPAGLPNDAQDVVRITSPALDARLDRAYHSVPDCPCLSWSISPWVQCAGLGDAVVRFSVALFAAGRSFRALRCWIIHALLPCSPFGVLMEPRESKDVLAVWVQVAEWLSWHSIMSISIFKAMASALNMRVRLCHCFTVYDTALRVNCACYPLIRSALPPYTIYTTSVILAHCQNDAAGTPRVTYIKPPYPTAIVCAFYACHTPPKYR